MLLILKDRKGTYMFWFSVRMFRTVSKGTAKSEQCQENDGQLKIMHISDLCKLSVNCSAECQKMN